jgi:hypothetical protein
MKRFSWIALVVFVAACGSAYANEPARKRITLANGCTAVAIHTSVSGFSSVSQSQTGAVAVAEPCGFYNANHPEKKPSERFIGNCTIKQFHQIRYRSKRLGQVACDNFGRKLTKIDPLGGRDYFPVFAKSEEIEAVKKRIAGEKKFSLYVGTRNTFFRGARVYFSVIEGCTTADKEHKMDFRLVRNETGRCWEKTVMVPGNSCVLEVVIKPKGKRRIRFLLYKKIEEGGSVNIILSSCPLPETFTRPRINLNSEYRWPATFSPPANIPAAYR